jgi:hypothetical protein
MLYYQKNNPSGSEAFFIDEVIIACFISFEVTENHEIVELLSSSNSISSVCKDGENVAFRK